MLHLPSLLQLEPLSPQEATADPCLRRRQTLRLRSESVSVRFLGPGAHTVLFEPSECLWCVWGLNLNAILPLLPSCWGFTFPFYMGYLFLVGSNILLSMVVQQWVVTLEMSTHPSTLPSCVCVCVCVNFPGGAHGKEPACYCRRCEKLGFSPWVGKISWRRAWQPTPVFLPGESHGQKSLAGYSPQGHTESDMTEVT